MEVKHCENCGRPFSPIPEMAPHKRFCSAVCRNEYHYQKTKIKRAERRIARLQEAVT
jgi:predicted nucleic acid-binding Zn ribbon protein